MTPLYTDHDSGYRRSVVPGLRRLGLDVRASAEVGNARLPDEKQLEFALSEGRMLFTANVGDFAEIHRAWLRAGRSHAGIIVRVPQDFPIGEQIRRLRDICQKHTPESARDQFIYLGGWRVS